MDANFDGASLGSFGEGDCQGQHAPQNVCFDFRSVNGRVQWESEFSATATDLKDAIVKPDIDGGGINTRNFDCNFCYFAI